MKRINSLDSLRGVAALIVVLSHLASTLPDLKLRLLRTVILRPLMMGTSWVQVFFVLSGFVLFLSFEQKDLRHYWHYFFKRIARIYPPLVVAVLASAALYLLIRPLPVPVLGQWFNDYSWSAGPTPAVIAGHLLLRDGMANQQLDNVIWSLVHEMRISIVFPLLALAMRRSATPTLIVTALLSIGCHLVTLAHPLTGFDPFATLQYLFCFAAGSALAMQADEIRRRVQRAPVWTGPVALLIGLGLLSFSPERAGGMLTAVGAILIVTTCFAAPQFERVLLLRPLVWLGRVSYSLYLIHLPILLALVHGTTGLLSPPLALLFVLPVALAAAELMYLTVERPSIRLGRAIVARLPTASHRVSSEAMVSD